MTLSVTTEFHAEFEAERERWLRNRLLWYCGFMTCVGLLALLFAILSLDSVGDALSADFMAKLLFRGGLVVLFGGAMAYASTRRRDLSRRRVLRLLGVCILTTGLVGLFVSPALAAAINSVSGSESGEGLRFGQGASWLFLIFVTHFAASLFIPWSPSESMRPMTPLLALASGMFIFAAIMGWDTWVSSLFGVALCWMVPLPGLAISWLRHSRHRQRFHLRALSGRYGAIKRELVDARRIHESLFPTQILEGPVRFAYRYEPMLQLGGDFVFVHPRPEHRDSSEPFSVALIDVTGHGIAAALTVNRLDGELQRLYAENPSIRPGEVVESINRYIHLTLAEHSVYATAFCARVDPQHDELSWANAGHPPGMLRDAAGRIEELVSTTFVLGAAAGGDFEANAETRRFGPGDTLLLYTDGAFEVRNHDGAMFSLDGLRRTLVRSAAVRAGEGELAQRVLDEVDRYRAGPPCDDTLILEVSRAVGAPQVNVRRAERVAGGEAS